MTPDEFTNRELFLEVGDGHRLYVHDWGNPKAKTPIVYLHGGPGNGCDDRDKDKFNPQTQRVIFHDQRGAGQSTPAASLKNNTSQHLVEDITKLADELKLKKLVLVGSSWGSTLALLYGIKYPGRVAGMVIDGVFTATRAEYDWLDKGQWRTFFPEVWEEYAASVPTAHRDDPTAYHFKQIFKGDAEARKKSAYAYVRMELALLKLDVRYDPGPFAKFDPGNGLIELHYMANHCFIEPDYIPKHAAKLNMLVGIIQGRYDMVCPPTAAYALYKALPKGRLVWTINGHLKQHEAKNILSLLLEWLTGEN